MSPSIVSRIGKLLAKAEVTHSQAEAEALFAKAQELASKHSVALAVARRQLRDLEAPETPESRTLHLGEARTAGLVQKVHLFGVIAKANDVRYSIVQGNIAVNPIGFPTDLDVVEALFACVAEQMVRLGNQWLAEGHWRADTYVTEQPYVAVGSDGVHRLEWARPMNARVARRRFYEGFVLAVGRRFLEARQAAESEAERGDLTRVVDSSGKELSVTTLALRDKRQQVDEFTAREFERQGVRGSWRGSRATAHGGDASEAAGFQAGVAANLTGRRQLV